MLVKPSRPFTQVSILLEKQCKKESNAVMTLFKVENWVASNSRVLKEFVRCVYIVLLWQGSQKL